MGLYYANVAVDVIKFFEEKLEERKDKIKVIEKSGPRVSENGVSFIRYILDAEDGLIKPEWKL